MTANSRRVRSHPHIRGYSSNPVLSFTRTALEMIIEKSGEVEVTAGAVVAAVQAYSKINAAGSWIEHTETTNLTELFDRMTREELDAYAVEGILPDWFLTATRGNS